jgi:hypothetical protein
VAKTSKSKKKKKKQQKSRSGGKGGTSGSMGSMRAGMKSMVGQGPKKKSSRLTQVLTYLLLAAAVALLVWRFTR